MITNSVLVAAENAILTKLLTAVAGTVCKSQIYISDEDVIKEPMPYIIVHAESYEEVIGPGIGIFHAIFSVVLHVSGVVFADESPCPVGPRNVGQLSSDGD